MRTFRHDFKDNNKGHFMNLYDIFLTVISVTTLSLLFVVIFHVRSIQDNLRDQDVAITHFIADGEGTLKLASENKKLLKQALLQLDNASSDMDALFDVLRKHEKDSSAKGLTNKIADALEDLAAKLHGDDEAKEEAVSEPKLPAEEIPPGKFVYLDPTGKPTLTEPAAKE